MRRSTSVVVVLETLEVIFTATATATDTATAGLLSGQLGWGLSHFNLCKLVSGYPNDAFFPAYRAVPMFSKGQPTHAGISGRCDLLEYLED